MDPDEKRLLTRLMNVERRLFAAKANDRLAYYNKPPTVHEKQMAFHRCPKRNRWVFGGNRSGKRFFPVFFPRGFFQARERSFFIR